MSVADLKEEFDEGVVLDNLDKLRSFTDDSMFWQTFVYEDVRLVSEKLKQRMQEDSAPSSGSPLYLHKEAINVRENETEIDSPSKVVKALKVGEAIELIPGGAEVPVTLENL